MKLLILLAQALLLIQIASAEEMTSSPALAKPKSVKVAKVAKKKKPVPSALKDKGEHLGTNFRFDGSSLHGKYQNPLSTTATVENDKYLDDLLGARKHFDDREKKDSERN